MVRKALNLMLARQQFGLPIINSPRYCQQQSHHN